VCKDGGKEEKGKIGNDDAGIDFNHKNMHDIPFIYEIRLAILNSTLAHFEMVSFRSQQSRVVST